MDMPEQPTSELALSRLVDAELVRLAREGSASALRLIIRRHNQRLYRVARAIVRDDAEAEDVMQEAYLSAFRHLAKFRADASLATWLTRIVVNKAVGHLQRERIMVPLDALDKVAWPGAGVIAMPPLASELDPSWQQPKLKLGLIAFSKGDKDTAIKIFESVIAADPNGPEAAQANAFLKELRK